MSMYGSSMRENLSGSVRHRHQQIASHRACSDAEVSNVRTTSLTSLLKKFPMRLETILQEQDADSFPFLPPRDRAQGADLQHKAAPSVAVTFSCQFLPFTRSQALQCRQRLRFYQTRPEVTSYMCLYQMHTCKTCRYALMHTCSIHIQTQIQDTGT